MTATKLKVQQVQRVWFKVQSIISIISDDLFALFYFLFIQRALDYRWLKICKMRKLKVKSLKSEKLCEGKELISFVLFNFANHFAKWKGFKLMLNYWWNDLMAFPWLSSTIFSFPVVLFLYLFYFLAFIAFSLNVFTLSSHHSSYFIVCCDFYLSMTSPSKTKEMNRNSFWHEAWATVPSKWTVEGRAIIKGNGCVVLSTQNIVSCNLWE